MSTNDSADSFHLAFGRGTGAGFQKGKGEAMDVSSPASPTGRSPDLPRVYTSDQPSH